MISQLILEGTFYAVCKITEPFGKIMATSGYARFIMIKRAFTSTYYLQMFIVDPL